ncbi:MAG: type IV pilin-like G/H family protein [Hormoscilla sp. GM102CHS1]|nr:type IV pilin-like G/H family protein [Hormoscilla sp. GM102CHS1]
MKTEFKTKFLQHLIDKKQDKGFTLIELLVVIIIIGILSAIALPSFLNQANKARQSEAKTYVGSMNRAQQAHFLENSEFAGDMNDLGLGISTQTDNYTYGIINSAGTGGGASTAVTNWATGVATNAQLLSYVGGVNLGKQTSTLESTTLAILCESNDIGKAQAAATYTTDGPTCPTGYDSL